MAESIEPCLGLSIIIGISIVIMIACGIRIVRPHQKGVVERVGSFIGIMDPGFHMVFPVITRITLMDMRLQSLDIPKQKVISSDRSIMYIDATVYIKVVDPYKAYYEVQNYRQATSFLAQQVLKSYASELKMDELLYDQQVISIKIRDILDRATLTWGLNVDNVEIRDVDVQQHPRDNVEHKMIPVKDGKINGSEVSAY
jgi:regulator of protease activity HflC (stomatin/prohibitin superfamily)